jgi:hypothetical protein
MVDRTMAPGMMGLMLKEQRALADARDSGRADGVLYHAALERDLNLRDLIAQEPAQTMEEIWIKIAAALADYEGDGNEGPDPIMNLRQQAHEALGLEPLPAVLSLASPHH